MQQKPCAITYENDVSRLLEERGDKLGEVIQIYDKVTNEEPLSKSKALCCLEHGALTRTLSTFLMTMRYKHWALYAQKQQMKPQR